MITPLPPPPSRTEPLEFSVKMDAFLGALPDFVTETNALAVDVSDKQTTASTAASTATTKATEAATRAAAALVSENNANTSESNAASSATAASTSATNAASSASTATTQANNASTSATNAANSASASAASAASASNIVLGVSTALPNMRPSLLLDFANSKTVDPRITFTRASTATYFDALGVMKTAATNAPRIDHDPITGECKGLLIEEARTNLLTYSEQFDNAAWSKFNATITANAVIAPDGTVTADKLVESTANAEYYARGAGTSQSAGTYTASVYVHVSSERNLYLRPVHFGDTNATSGVQFNIATETLDAPTGNGVSAGFQKCANGWYRVWLVFTTTAERTLQHGVQPLSGGTHFYTGDGTSGLYIWGAQLEAGSFPTSYIPSTDTFTSRASTATFTGSNGLIQSASTNVARMNYNPMNLTLAPKLLLEGASTNLLAYSEDLANAAWGKTNVTVTADSAVAPDGTTTADKVFETVANSQHNPYASAMVTAGTAYTVSIYAKAAERQRIVFGFVANGGVFAATLVIFDLNTGAATPAVGASLGYSITPVGNGWYRCSVTQVALLTGAGYVVTYLDNGSATTYSGDITKGLYLWGAQLEAGSLSSYIPTTSAAVTRAADISTSAATTRAADVASMTGANFSSWYRQDEGTFVVSGRSEVPPSGIDGILLDVGAGGAFGTSVYLARTSTGYSAAPAAAPVTLGISGTVNTVDFAIALGLKANDAAMATMGGVAATDTSCSMPASAAQLSLAKEGWGVSNYLNGHISRLAYYPKRLSNSELQALSS